MIKKVIIILTFLLLTTNLCYSEIIRFAPIPNAGKETLIGSHMPLIDYLRKKTGLSINFIYIENYKSLLDEFKKGNVNLITLGPLPYVTLKKDFNPAQVIAMFREKDGSTRYSCALITSAKGPKKIKDIKGPIALPQKTSTCGYFWANMLLNQEGMDIKKIKYTHLTTHNEVAENVIRGNFEVGTLKKDIAEQYKGFGIRILKESPKWPGFIVIANTNALSPETIKKIKDALLTIPQEESKNLVQGKYGFADCDDRDFDIIRKYEKFNQ